MRYFELVQHKGGIVRCEMLEAFPLEKAYLGHSNIFHHRRKSPRHSPPPKLARQSSILAQSGALVG